MKNHILVMPEIKLHSDDPMIQRAIEETEKYSNYSMSDIIKVAKLRVPVKSVIIEAYEEPWKPGQSDSRGYRNLSNHRRYRQLR